MDVVSYMDKSTVALVKGERGHEPVFKALDLIDYKSCLRATSGLS